MDSSDAYSEFAEGMKVEARYQGHGAWYAAKVVKIHHDGKIDVVYHDGEAAVGLHPSTVRRFREGNCCCLC